MTARKIVDWRCNPRRLHSALGYISLAEAEGRAAYPCPLFRGKIMDQFYSELKGWRGAIGSALGFLALLTGALWNFHLNRRRDAELRLQEARSIAAALYGEILHIRKAAALLASRYARRYLDLGISWTRREVDGHFVAELKLPEPLLFRALAPKVGLLPSSTISAVVQFYSDAYEGLR